MPRVVSLAPGVNPSQPTNRVQRGSQRCQWPGWRRCGAIPSVALTNGGQSLRDRFPAACGVDFMDERLYPQEPQCNGVDVPHRISGEVPTSGV